MAARTSRGHLKWDLIATGYLTTMALTVVPSVPLPRNLLLFADSADPLMAVVLLKKSLFVRRSDPPAELTPMLLLANVLFITFTWQLAADRTPPFAPLP